jgi:RHS repeat-associated protein
MTYDVEKRITSAEYTDSVKIIHKTTYSYSGDGLLAVTRKYEGTTMPLTLKDTVRYIRDGLLPVEERDASNIVTREYTWGKDMGGGIGGLLNLRQNGQDYNYLYDGKGNVTALIDGTQTPVVTYAYDPFGKLMKKTGTFDQPYMFSTKPYDPDTGLYYFGARFYSPILRRWINRDPAGEASDFNLYRAGGNNIVNRIDPYGLTWLEFDRDKGTLTVHSGSILDMDSKSWSFPASNNASRNSRGTWNSGWYSFDYWVAHSGEGQNGSYGSNGNFVFSVIGCNGCGVHAGRANSCDRANRCGVEHATLGCIRTTDDATSLLKSLNQSGDRVYLLHVW